MSSIYAERAQCLKLYQLKIGPVLKVNFWIRFNIYEFHTSKLYLIPLILYQKLSSLIFVCKVKCRVKIMTKTFQNVFDQTILWNFWFVCVAYWSQYLLGAFKKQVEKYSVSLTPLLLNRHARVSVPAERLRLAGTSWRCNRIHQFRVPKWSR